MTLPLSAPGIVAGLLLTFIPAIGDYVNAYFLGGPNQAMIGNVIQGQYLTLADYPEASALSFVLLALIMVVVLAYFRVAGTGAITGDDEAVASEGGGRPDRPPRLGGRFAWLRDRSLGIYAGFAVAYMLIPIAVIVLFSFNDPQGNFNVTWQGFTLDYWPHPFSNSELTDAMVPSLELAALATIDLDGPRDAAGAGPGPSPLPRAQGGEPAVGRAAGHAGGRDRGGVAVDVRLPRGRARIRHAADRPRDVLDQLRDDRRPLAADRLRPQPRGGRGRPRRGTARALPTITMPLLAPAIASAALLAFVLSIDDFVISNFNSGTTVTFPLYIFGASQRGIPVQINVLATMLLVVTVIGMVATIWQQRRADRLAAPLPEARG